MFFGIVSILILLEVILEGNNSACLMSLLQCFNPYSTGSYSGRVYQVF